MKTLVVKVSDRVLSVTMIAYRITYQTRRKTGISTHQGDWQDKEDVVVAGDDAREAVNEIVDSLSGHDF